MTGLLVDIDNPFISSSFASALASRPNPTSNFQFRKRMEQVGVRIQEHNNKQFQFVTGSVSYTHLDVYKRQVLT